MNTHNETTFWEPSSILTLFVSAFDLLGLFGNIVFFVTITYNKVESEVTTFLLLHQSAIDGISCLLAYLTIKTPPWTSVGNQVLDVLFCYLWYSQVVYWICVFMSVQNLIMTAVDRFCAIVLPTSYRSYQKRLRVGVIVLAYPYSFLFTVPISLQVNFVNQTCVQDIGFDEEHSDIWHLTYAIVWSSTAFLIPSVLFIVLYVKIGIVLWRKSSSSSSRVINSISTSSSQPDLNHRYRSASRQFTITTAIIVLLFIVCFGVECVEYNLRLKTFDMLFMKVGLFLISVNSILNPYIYFIMIKSIRLKVISTLTYPYRFWKRKFGVEPSGVESM